jgi:hypothetical protein
MFSPIAAYAIGGTTDAVVVGDTVAAGVMDFTGSASGTSPIFGAASTTLTLVGSASSVEATEEGSLLGWGPIGSGAIAEGPTIATVTSGPTGTAAGTFDLLGAVTGRVLVTGRAPDLILSPWSVTAGSASATINTYPTPPTTPPWSISIEPPGFRIVDFPESAATLPQVPYFDLIGAATGGLAINLLSNGNFGLTGLAAANSPIAATGSGAFDLTGASLGQTGISMSAASAFDLTGSAAGIYGTGPISGIGDSLFDLTGAATLVSGVNGEASSEFAITISATATVILAGAAAGIFDLTGSSRISLPAGRRTAFPSQSANSVEIIQAPARARVIGE